MEIVHAKLQDLDAATGALVAAFAADPLLDYFFLSIPERRNDAAREFFSLLLTARLELGMPVLLGKEQGTVVGAAMGYDTRSRDWPTLLSGRWDAFEASIPGMTERTEAYSAISHKGLPETPHYYLGVLGVVPACQGKGAGTKLLGAFCALAAADCASTGVYLETATAANLPLYRRAGFVETARGSLGAAALWCLFRPQGSGVAVSAST